MTQQELAQKYLDELDGTKSFARRVELVDEWFHKRLRLRLKNLQGDELKEAKRSFNVKV